MERTDSSARERLLREMTRASTFTIPQLAEAAGATYSSAGRLVWELRRAGNVRCETPKSNGRRGGVAVYVADSLPRRAASTKRTARFRMWRSLRVLRRCTVAELAAASEARKSNTFKFLADLERAGVVRIVRPRISGVR